MDTTVFGHVSWDVMNWAAAVVAAHPGSSAVVRAALTFLVSLCFLLPCEPCRKFYLVVWCTMPPPPEADLLGHPSKLQDWVYDIQSIVASKVNVTKHKLLCPTRCITPGLSRFALARRRDVLGVLGGPAQAIGARDVLAVALLGADACRRHDNPKRRVAAWRSSWEALGALAAAASLPWAPVFETEKSHGGKSHAAAPPFRVVTAAVNAWRVGHKLKPVSAFVLMDAMKRGLGPLKGYMQKTIK